MCKYSYNIAEKSDSYRYLKKAFERSNFKNSYVATKGINKFYLSVRRNKRSSKRHYIVEDGARLP